MIKRQMMPELEADVRKTNFSEVALGFNREQVRLEASRCLDCKNPRCVKACPVNIDIPKFIKEILNDDYQKAYNTIYQENILPAICGRVCPQEKQCEGACILGIKSEPVAIGSLERFIGDEGLKNLKLNEEIIKENNVSVAIVGSGPAGLAASASLRRMGYKVDVYEALHEFGGVLKYGIPEFRLPKALVDSEIERLKNIGVKFHKNVIIGKTLTIEQLFKEYEYKAIFLGTGAGLPSSLKISGENLNGVYYANEFLTRVNLMRANLFPDSATPIKLGEKVAVVGGGNVAMDAARTAKRLGAKTVMIVYRRDEESLPARLAEIDHAKAEGIEFHLLRNPVEIKGADYEVKSVVLEKMVLGDLDSSGRARPMPTRKYEEIKIDNLIIAIGQSPNPMIKNNTPMLKTDSWGRVIVKNHQTSIKGVFAGGDAVSGAATVILAMGAGKEAALKMDQYIKSL